MMREERVPCHRNGAEDTIVVNEIRAKVGRVPVRSGPTSSVRQVYAPTFNGKQKHSGATWTHRRDVEGTDVAIDNG
ncbi:hypothetical protein CMUS01_13480 [Colletotrichum musicola]|uniref:Uncharacterized protein n=1 Tax=Colletotrichum musicola TaxID=2175873 RepID=A0A8H6MW19_9PEZI|nr:hypothetical protein CMUS01_13480 [Colletotrichum musicola]